MVKIYYYKSKGIYDPRDIIYTAKLKKKKKNQLEMGRIVIQTYSRGYP